MIFFKLTVWMFHSERPRKGSIEGPAPKSIFSASSLSHNTSPHCTRNTLSPEGDAIIYGQHLLKHLPLSVLIVYRCLITVSLPADLILIMEREDSTVYY